jgi:hypothetical protein
MIKIVCCAMLLLICIGGFFWFLVNVVFLSVGSKNDEKKEPKTPPSEAPQISPFQDVTNYGVYCPVCKRRVLTVGKGGDLWCGSCGTKLAVRTE